MMEGRDTLFAEGTLSMNPDPAWQQQLVRPDRPPRPPPRDRAHRALAAEMHSAGSATTSIYDQPQYATPSSSSATPSSSSSAALLREDGHHRQTPLPQQDRDDDETKKLERSTRRLRKIFHLLVTLCIIVVLVYLGVIAVLLNRLRLMDSVPLFSSSASTPAQRSASQGGSQQRSGIPVADPERDCVHEEEMRRFREIWDAQEEEDVMDTVKRLGEFVYNSGSRLYCFKSMKWVPHIMGKMNSRVQYSISVIESEQERINNVIGNNTAANASHNQCTDKRGPSQEEPADHTNSVFAHFFLDDQRPYVTSERVSTLRWSQEGQKSSSRSGVNVVSSTGLVTIRTSGFYFLYTHLVFRDRDSKSKSKDPQLLHHVVRTRNGMDTFLLESVQGGTSLLQGVFELRQDDQLRVKASKDNLDTSRNKMSYFGMYLIRT
ncbi:uncharacterized protein LOC143289189 [Babylonia areolata]|uniref:uncharacterized protein LOC143289189 n=1 Tax=Babylonia areolata TaxID=304850 RepID=UPI003FD66299